MSILDRSKVALLLKDLSDGCGVVYLFLNAMFFCESIQKNWHNLSGVWSTPFRICQIQSLLNNLISILGTQNLHAESLPKRDSWPFSPSILWFTSSFLLFHWFQSCQIFIFGWLGWSAISVNWEDCTTFGARTEMPRFVLCCEKKSWKLWIKHYLRFLWWNNWTIWSLRFIEIEEWSFWHSAARRNWGRSNFLCLCWFVTINESVG
jgi:hypothetical protein